MFKRLLGIFGALALLVSFIPLNQVSAVDWWDTDYHYRLPITIDADLIDTDLTDFPVYIELSETSGLTSVDISHVFDTLGEDYLKLAVVSGVSQCYVEVVEWDTANDYAELHTKIPEVDDTLDTVIYLYYDAAVEDNTTYVGLTGSVPAQNVWSNGFVAVYHMNDNPLDSTQILDSTSNENHGTKGEACATNAANISNGTGTLETNPTSVAAGLGTTTVTVTGAGTFTIRVPTNQVLIVEKGTVTSVWINSGSEGSRTITVTGTGTFFARWAETRAPTEVDGLIGKGQEYYFGTYITASQLTGINDSLTFESYVQGASYYGSGASGSQILIRNSFSDVSIASNIISNRLNFSIYDAGVPAYVVGRSTSANLVDGTDYYLAATYNGAASLYVNGAVDAGFSQDNYPTSGNYLGVGSHTTERYLRAIYSETRISKTARDGGWVGTTNLSLRDELNTVGVVETYPYPPTNLTSEIDTNNIRLNWTLGVNATGVKIIRGNVDYPTSLTDGIEVYSGTGTTYTDEGIVDDTTTYYYSAFSYNDNFTNTAIYAITSIGGEALFLLILVLLPLALMIAGFALRRGSMAMAAMGAWFILCVYSYMQTGEIYNAIFWISIALTITSGLEGAMIMRKGEEQAEDAIAYENELDIASKNIDDRIAALRAKRR